VDVFFVTMELSLALAICPALHTSQGRNVERFGCYHLSDHSANTVAILASGPKS